MPKKQSSKQRTKVTDLPPKKKKLNKETMKTVKGGVAVDPSDSSGNTVFISGASGGVWKTKDR